ncbi:MAG TPA: hypothetical protein VHG28_04215, partial [Longimicrobiaceae bacterium]|nr:hypothetical protein [Longimicrobiaceae bacterium]
MSERLYPLVPAIYRIRDLAEGEPLRALLGVVEEEFLALERDVEGLYDNWFIETCDEWVAPYIGDLLAVRRVHGEHLPAPGHRARVANTLRYRRRKGLPSVLGFAAQDATGWRARVVEFFAHLGATQHMQHPRPGRGGCADLRRSGGVGRAGGAWDGTAHSCDLRVVGPGRGGASGGRYNLGQVGLFLWRLSAYPVEGGSARRVRPGGYTFHSLGVDTPLLNLPQTGS